jgi:aspartate/methionine/tyrosine aminotransferase
VRTNLDVVRRAVTPTSAVTPLDVEGGWYATLRVPRTRSDEAWALSLLSNDGVYVHPGHFFDFPRDGHLVVSLLTPEDELASGIARIIARVDGGDSRDVETTGR